MSPRAITIAALLTVLLGGGTLLLIGRSLRDDPAAGEDPAGTPAGPAGVDPERTGRSDGRPGSGETGGDPSGAAPGDVAPGRPGRAGGAAGAGRTAPGGGNARSAKDDGGKRPEPAAPPPLGKGDGTLAVVVVDPDGQPLPGAAVEIRGSGGARSGATGAGGVAEMAGIPSGGYEVRIRPPGAPALRAARTVEVPPGGRAEVRCQVPAFDGEIAGRVLDGAGELVTGIEIEARPIGIPGGGVSFLPEGAPSEAASGPDGSFRLEGLPRVEHSLTTRETPRYPSARAVAIAGSGERVDLVLAGRRTLALLGTVIEDEGTPVEGAAVTILTHPGETAATDSAGRFRTEIAYERGAVAIAAKKEGYARGEAIVPAAEIGDREEVEVEIRLEPMGKVGDVEGRIADAEGSPVPRQVVHIHSSSLGATYQAASAEDGTYAIREVRAAADYRAWVNPDRGYRDFARAPVEILEGTNRLDIELAPIETGRLSGIMVDPSGRPISRLTLHVRSLAATGNAVPITGDEAGRFAAGEVPAGDLYFETRAAPLVSVRGVRLEPGEEKEAEILVGLGEGRLNGAVAGGSGGAVAGARVTLTWSGTKGTVQSNVFREAVTNAAGKFAFTGIAKGRGSISVAAPGHEERRESRELTGGSEEIRIEIEER